MEILLCIGSWGGWFSRGRRKSRTGTQAVNSHVRFQARQGNAEVDFAVARGADVWALEIKSGRAGKTAGLAAFRRKFPRARCLLVGGGGIPLEEFFPANPEVFFSG
jgi:hypothetical protein